MGISKNKQYLSQMKQQIHWSQRLNVPSKHKIINDLYQYMLLPPDFNLNNETGIVPGNSRYIIRTIKKLNVNTSNILFLAFHQQTTNKISQGFTKQTEHYVNKKLINLCWLTLYIMNPKTVTMRKWITNPAKLNKFIMDNKQEYLNSKKYAVTLLDDALTQFCQTYIETNY